MGHSRRKKTKMKTFFMLSVFCLLLILETSSRPGDDKSDESKESSEETSKKSSDEKSSEECGDSDECGSDEDPSSREELNTSAENELFREPSVASLFTSYTSNKCPKKYVFRNGRCFLRFL